MGYNFQARSPASCTPFHYKINGVSMCLSIAIAVYEIAVKRGRATGSENFVKRINFALRPKFRQKPIGRSGDIDAVG